MIFLYTTVPNGKAILVMMKFMDNVSYEKQLFLHQKELIFSFYFPTNILK